MSNLDKSFATLVKYNNGMFKSDKQAKFLSQHLDYDLGEGIHYTTPNNVWGNSYIFAYSCDALGVTKVEKITGKGTVVTWERDTTNEWQDVNQKREAQKQLAAWINKAHKTQDRMEAMLLRKVTNSAGELNMPVMISMSKKRQRVLRSINDAHEKFQQGYTA